MGKTSKQKGGKGLMKLKNEFTNVDLQSLLKAFTRHEVSSPAIPKVANPNHLPTLKDFDNPDAMVRWHTSMGEYIASEQRKDPMRATETQAVWEDRIRGKIPMTSAISDPILQHFFFNVLWRQVKSNSEFLLDPYVINGVEVMKKFSDLPHLAVLTAVKNFASNEVSSSSHVKQLKAFEAAVSLPFHASQDPQRALQLFKAQVQVFEDTHGALADVEITGTQACQVMVSKITPIGARKEILLALSKNETVSKWVTTKFDKLDTLLEHMRPIVEGWGALRRDYGEKALATVLYSENPLLTDQERTTMNPRFHSFFDPKGPKLLPPGPKTGNGRSSAPPAHVPNKHIAKLLKALLKGGGGDTKTGGDQKKTKEIDCTACGKHHIVSPVIANWAHTG